MDVMVSVGVIFFRVRAKGRWGIPRYSWEEKGIELFCRGRKVE